METFFPQKFINLQLTDYCNDQSCSNGAVCTVKDGFAQCIQSEMMGNQILLLLLIARIIFGFALLLLRLLKQLFPQLG